MSAHAIEFAVGQDPQQARLRFGGHVADLVQEQRAAVGLFEASRALCRGAGEGALLMTEEFGLDQILGDGGHVQSDELVLLARAVAMQGMGHQFLARAGFPVDEHGDIGL